LGVAIPAGVAGATKGAGIADVAGATGVHRLELTGAGCLVADVGAAVGVASRRRLTTGRIGMVARELAAPGAARASVVRALVALFAAVGA
jgi:hypothetical protein